MSRSKAMAFATRAAKALGTPGERTHVCVLDDYGCLRSVLPLELHKTHPRREHPVCETSATK
jgi:hypothetical protein